MSGVDAALVVGLFVTLLLAVAAGGFLAARNPTFWAVLGGAVFTQIMPLLKEYFSRRNTPEVEAEMAACVRRGGKWNNFKKRCE